MQINTYDMQINMKNNSSLCIFSILQYTEYAEYIKKYSEICK
jgi:hypothetical protein